MKLISICMQSIGQFVVSDQAHEWSFEETVLFFMGEVLWVLTIVEY